MLSLSSSERLCPSSVRASPTYLVCHGDVQFRTSTFWSQQLRKMPVHHREQELAARAVSLPRLVFLPRELHTPEGSEVDVKTLAWRKRNSSRSR